MLLNFHNSIDRSELIDIYTWLLSADVNYFGNEIFNSVSHFSIEIFHFQMICDYYEQNQNVQKIQRSAKPHLMFADATSRLLTKRRLSLKQPN